MTQRRRRHRRPASTAAPSVTFANGSVARRPDHRAHRGEEDPGGEAGDRRRRRPGRRPARRRHRAARSGRRPWPARRAGRSARLTTGEMMASRPNVSRTTGQRGGLGGERDAQRLREPAREPAAGQAVRIRSVQPAGPGEDPARRQRRELEARIEDELRIGDEQERRRPAERGRGAPGSARLAGEEHDTGHGGRPDDRRRSAGEQDVREDRRDEHDACAGDRAGRPAPQPSRRRSRCSSPEIATTWLAPTVVKAAARSRSTRSRRPMTIPAARPASGSGIAAARASPGPPPEPLEPAAGTVVRPTTASGRDWSVPPTPIRAGSRRTARRAAPGCARRPDPVSPARSPEAWQRGGDQDGFGARGPVVVALDQRRVASCWPSRSGPDGDDRRDPRPARRSEAAAAAGGRRASPCAGDRASRRADGSSRREPRRLVRRPAASAPDPRAPPTRAPAPTASEDRRSELGRDQRAIGSRRDRADRQPGLEVIATTVSGPRRGP